MQVGAFFFACLQGETGEEWPGQRRAGALTPPPLTGGEARTLAQRSWAVGAALRAAPRAAAARRKRRASPFLGRLRAELGRGDALRLASCENCCYNQNGKQECETQMGVEEKCPSSVWNI